MPPFSMAGLVTQTDNGTGNQLKKYIAQAPHPPDPPPPSRGRSTEGPTYPEMTVTELFVSTAMSDS